MVNHPSSVVHDRNLINIFIVKLILHLYTQSIRSLMKRPLFLSRSLNRFWPPFPLHDMKFFYVDPCSRMNWLEMKISLTYKKVKEPSCTVMKSLFYPANYLSKLVIPILLVCTRVTFPLHNTVSKFHWTTSGYVRKSYNIYTQL